MEGFKNKKSKTESALGKISKIAKFATLGTGLAISANNLEAQEIPQNKDENIKPELEKNINIEDEKSKPINGGNIEEVTVYSKRKYVNELKKQQEKYLADMAKYNKDSVEWVQLNKAYNDSLKLYETSKKQLDKMMSMVDFIDDDGKTRLTAEEIQKKRKEIDPMWDGTYGQVEYGDFRSVANGYKGHAYAVLHDMGMSDNGQIYSNESADNKSWASEKREDARDFINKIEKNEIKPKFAPILFFDHPYNPNEHNYNYRAVYDKPKGIKMSKPERPNNIKVREIKYDPKYENLKMRSLWATILKQDPNAKIGTLHILDQQFEKGFTLDEVMTFPQEIKDQYNIDYIYNQIHKIEKPQKEDYKHPGWDYNEPTE